MSKKIPPFWYNKCGSPTANKNQKGGICHERQK